MTRPKFLCAEVTDSWAEAMPTSRHRRDCGYSPYRPTAGIESRPSGIAQPDVHPDRAVIRSSSHVFAPLRD